MHTVEEIAALLQIHKEAAAHGGPMNNISAAALNRLKQINAEMGSDGLGGPKILTVAEQNEIDAKARIDRQAEVDKQAEEQLKKDDEQRRLDEVAKAKAEAEKTVPPVGFIDPKNVSVDGIVQEPNPTLDGEPTQDEIDAERVRQGTVPRREFRPAATGEANPMEINNG